MSRSKSSIRSYAHLFSPIKVGNLTLKNRIGAAPMGVSDLTPEGYFTPANIAVFRRKAQSGVSVVNLGEAQVDGVRGKAHGRITPLDDVECLPTLIDCCDAIKQYGAIPAIELVHCGCRARPEYCKAGPIGPSAHMGIYGEMVEAMTEAQIQEVAEQFGKAAFMAQCGGVEMVTLHAAHGWIFTQFLAKSTNQRTDQYGGSLENRARITLLAVDAIRAHAPGVAVEIRMSGSDLYEGGVTLEESIAYAKLLDGRVDLLHISAGSFHVPDTSTRMFPSAYEPEGVNVPFAEAVKKAVKTPVATVGSLGDPDLMEEIVAGGKADIVYIARALMADEFLPEKIRTGRADEITPCLRCNMCLSLSFVPHVPFAVRVMRCSVNPTVGFELETQNLQKAEQRKKVLIAGGGPGGMEAAVTAAERGHEVILCEKSDRLGGMLVSADGIPFKHFMKRYRESLIRRVYRNAIKVLLETEVTPELVALLRPDVLIAAVGAEPIVPGIPGIEGPNVYFAARDFGLENVGNKVVVVGGGLVGCEEGLYHAQCGKEVHILEMGPKLAPEAWYLHLRATMNEMEKAGVHSYLNTRCTKITPEGVFAVENNGNELFFKADTVLVAAGLRSRSGTVEALRYTAPNFAVVGDCLRPRTIQEAVRTGYNAAVIL
jgi:2,4-dienoyl-CoA reductase-like NADH-dependent reductase (Old Yellow Enzyme family)/NADPH-dependent 2,4-dienoyl-CoA reductase/sulfur reductase-like enzyme